MSEVLKPFRTIRDILAEAARLHRDGRARFHAAACACPDHRQRALLAFLGDREADDLAALSRLQSSGDDGLEGFVQSVPAAALAEAESGGDLPTEIDAIVSAYVQRDLALTRLYQQIGDNVGPRARRILDGLVALRRQNQARLHEALFDF